MNGKMEKVRIDAIFSDVSEVDGMWCLADINTSTTMQLPPMESDEFSLNMDNDIHERLKISKKINFCRTVWPIFPLKLHNSDVGDHPTSLLVAVSMALWGMDDPGVVGRLRRLMHLALTQSGAHLRTRWMQARDVDDGGLPVQADVEVRWQTACFVFDPSMDHTRLATTQRGASIDPIHIFVLSNVIRRPLVVIDGDDLSAPEVGGGSMCGIYLPLVHDASTCCRSPVTLLVTKERVIPLVFASGSQTGLATGYGLQQAAELEHLEPAVPLVDGNMAPLPVRCLLSPAEKVETVLPRYLHTTEMPFTTFFAVSQIPVARVDTKPPPVGFDLMSSSNTAASGQHRSPVDRFVGTLNPATEALAAFTQGSDEDLNASPCVTSGCGFFGRRNWGGLCSECYKKQQVHQLPIQGHSALVQPTELADVASRRRHVVEYEYGLPKGPFDVTPPTLTSAIHCSVPHCSQPVVGGGQYYCGEHVPYKRPPVPFVTSEYAASALNPIIDELNLHGCRGDQPPVPCVAPGCDLFGLPEQANLCSRHFAARNEHLSTGGVGRTQVSRLVCRNVTCNRQGSPHCEGLCPQCYVSTNVATPARGSPARTVQQPAGTGLMVGSQAAAPMKSCIMDFCSNIGLTECKGLCEKCFAVVYQGRVLGDRTQTAAASQPLNVAEPNGFPAPTAHRCIMEGCRKPPVPGEVLCITCLTKQKAALADLAARLGM